MFRSSLLRWSFVAPLALAASFIPKPASAPPIDPSLYAGLQWRNIGPFRGGRIAAVSGAIGQPGVFYAGLPVGGILKTTSAGETWYPVFDSIKTVSSVGAIEVAPSNPDVIYAGTGDPVAGGAIDGDGIYKSIDAGRTWQHLGLDASGQMPSILVDPQDPNLVMVAALGSLRRRGGNRGVFRSTDGGRTWTNTLYVADTTGAGKLARAYDKPTVVFAFTGPYYSAPGPPHFTAPSDTGPTSFALYKSTDEGITWKEVTGGGLPRLNGRLSVAVAMNTNAQRVFLISNTGLYRSDDGGATWRQMAKDDERIRNGQGGYNCGVYVDPKNPDVVYTVNTSSYKSTDGGNTFTGFKGAPGGDDPQQMWIDPTNGQRMLFGYDQGAIVSLDGGTTWSSWYNQSNEQVYHVAADNSFPYWVYATQQDAGAIRQRSRGNFGAITPADWNSVNGWEWGTIIPDPLNTNIVYATGSGIHKISYPSEQWISVSPATDPKLELRTGFSQPIAFAPWNQHELLAGFQYLMATTDGGMHWRKISPDLGVPKNSGPTLAGRTAADSNAQRLQQFGGVIETISPSSVAAGTIWVGTISGLIKLTRDEGKTWQDVSIPDFPNQGPVYASIDASHTDAAVAYVAIDNEVSGDLAPYVYRTRDFGKTWTKIVDGLPTGEPAGSFVRVVRADTKKAGLLFAGTESRMFVSFDDGDHWQSLMLNLPTTSFRDIAIHDNDLVVGTYGRGIWILDEYTVLRQLTPQIGSEAAHLYKPADAVRVRRNVNADTPFPPEVPQALNPPDGAIIYYSLGLRPTTSLSLDVIDAAGKVVRHISSAASVPVKEFARPPEPNFWLAPPMGLTTSVGMNRSNWDLRYDDPPAFTHTYEINANPGLTPPSPVGPMAPPGVYTIKLTVDGKTYSQTLTVSNDPRSPATLADVREQHVLLQKLDDGLHATWDGYQQAVALREAVKSAVPANASAEVSAAITAFDAKLDSVASNPEGPTSFPRGGRQAAPSFVSVSGALVGQLNAQDNGDLAPTPGMLAAYANACNDLKTVDSAWKNVTTRELAALNVVLAKNGIRQIEAPASSRAAAPC